MSGIVLNMVITVALNAPKSNDKFIRNAQVVFSKMQNNPNFMASAAQVTKLGADIQQLTEAQITCKTIPLKKNIADRNAKLRIVMNDLRLLRNDVQVVADSDRENAATIITSAGMFVKRVTSHARRQNTAKNGTEEGTVILVGIGSRAHNWQISEDGIVWTNLPGTINANNIVRDLKPGTVYYFQNQRVFARNRVSEWSPVVKIRTN